MKINGYEQKVSTAGSRVIITDDKDIEQIFNARQIAMVKQGWRRRANDVDPYTFTVAVFGSRGLLSEFEMETSADAGALLFAFKVAMGSQ